MIKVQKRSKEIGKIIHVTSRAQTSFLRSYENIFVCKENKNKDFIQQFVSSFMLENIGWMETVHSSVSAAPRGYVFYVYLRFDFKENSRSGKSANRRAYAVSVQRIFSKMVLG